VAGTWVKGLGTRVGREDSIRQTTVDLYARTVKNHLLGTPLAATRLQKLTPSAVEQHCASLHLATKSLDLVRGVLSQALEEALRDRKVERNVVEDSRRITALSTHQPRQRKPVPWTAAEAQTFLETATADGPQPAALYSLALDSGARKGELLGLRWSDVDLEAGTVTIAQQLLANGPTPTFGPPKGGRARTVHLDVETCRLLDVHRRHQLEVMLRTKRWHVDLGLVFADEGDRSGQPLMLKSIGQGEFARLTKLAKVTPVRFHDLRHTAATLLLQAGEQVHVVSQRLGHASPTITLNVYSHVLEEQAKGAARTIGGLIHRVKG
jgi:integrase